MGIDPDILKGFSSEMRKEALSGEALLDVAKRFGKGFAGQAAAPLAVLHPSGEYLKKGWEALSNVSPEAIERMGVNIAGKAHPEHYVADLHSGMGVSDALRRQGWLANVPRYVGPDKMERAKNLAMRALPGQKSLYVIPSAISSAATLKQNVDPETGRQIGLGERVGGAALGFGSGLVSSALPGFHGSGRAGFAGALGGSMIGQMLGEAAGRRAGRALDTSVQHLTSRVPHNLSPEEIQSVRMRSQG